MTSYGRCHCPECGRIVSTTRSGLVRRHRAIAPIGSVRELEREPCRGSNLMPARIWGGDLDPATQAWRTA